MSKTGKAILGFTLALSLLFGVSNKAFTEISPELKDYMSAMDDSEYVRILIDFDNPNTMLKSAPVSLEKGLSPAEGYSKMNAHLRREAESNENALDSLIQKLTADGSIRNYKVFWIAGMACAEAKEDGVIVLNTHPAVEMVELDFAVTAMEPVMVQSADDFSAGIEVGIDAIGAREAWERGFDGSGSLVCNIDTGVDGNHQALSANFKGNNGYPMSECWYDPYSNTQFPQDTRGHGTHTMGTMIGHNDGDTIGVAPGAMWIAAASVDRGGNLNRTISDIIASFEWAADPDGNPGTTADRPDVINNSWGVPRSLRPDCDQTFWEAIDNCEEMGIVCIFAAGNEGPDPQSLRTPADRPTSDINSFAVGAVNATDGSYYIANFSSRGPSGCDGLIVKPNVVAPGVSVRSSLPGNIYGSLNGTSMAAPHVAGAVAILRQARPEATVAEIKYALMRSATDLGVGGPDYDYGYGMINIPAALDTLLNATGIVDDDTIEEMNMPFKATLYGNYPNPFNSRTNIEFSIAADSDVKLEIYNIAGKKISTLIDKKLTVGDHLVTWDGTDENGNAVSTGVYFVKMNVDGNTDTRRMTLIK